jgi:putative sigma-54 modulation protein
MNLTITGRQLDVAEPIRRDIDKKLQRLDRVLSDSAVSAQCVLSKQRGVFVCELTVHARGDHMLHGVGRHGQMPRAVSLAVDKVTQQAQKLKDRWKTRRRTVVNGAPSRTVAAEPVIPPERTQRVIRSRPNAFKPMTLDDAILALADGNQNFLVFRQANSDAVAILYRRPDGHFGLIEPEA